MIGVHFAPYVGISPSTTTMQLDGLGGDLGVCPPGHYGQQIMLPGGTVPHTIDPSIRTANVFNPYATESKLKGLGMPSIRWDLLVLSFGAAFAGWLGYSWWRSRRRS